MRHLFCYSAVYQEKGSVTIASHADLAALSLVVVTCLMADEQLCVQVGTNPPCCGDIYHFDLSYWAFQNVRTPNTKVSGAWLSIRSSQ